MNALRLVLCFSCAPLLVPAGFSADARPETHRVTALAFLTGDWRSRPDADGRVAEEHFSRPEGGVMLSTGREFVNGKCVFFDLVVFAEDANGSLVLTPHPKGRRSEHSFPLVAYDAAAKRVVFENTAHDFPKSFAYELVEPDHLRITLTGEIKGEIATEVYELYRTP
jgi:hypothetical protein